MLYTHMLMKNESLFLLTATEDKTFGIVRFV